MPNEMFVSYSFHTAEPSGAQTVTATVTRGNVPVAPEPAYIELDAQGFTLPAAAHATIDPRVTGLFYKTVWRGQSGTFSKPKNLSVNDKSTIHGPKFMWVFEEAGTYVADVTVINMYDHSEVATTTITVEVEDYLDWFTADGSNRGFFVVTRDGSMTGLPAQAAGHSSIASKNTLAQAANDLAGRENLPTCILVKEGETHPERTTLYSANTPNVYIRTYTGNLGTEAPKLTADIGIHIGDKFPTAAGISVQISGLQYDGGGDPTDVNTTPADFGRFCLWNAGGEHIVTLHDCKSQNHNMAFQSYGAGRASRGVFWDCGFSGSAGSDVLQGFGKFTCGVGSSFTQNPDAPNTFPGFNGGWSVRLIDDCHWWQCEIGSKGSWDNTNHLQPSLRVGNSGGNGGGYVYVGGCTLHPGISFGTNGNNTTVNSVVEGSRIAMLSQRLYGGITTLLTGIRMFNNIIAFPSAKPHVGNPFRGNHAVEWQEIGTPTPDAGVLNAGLDAQFNTRVSFCDVSSAAVTSFLQTDYYGRTVFNNLVVQNNVTHAPYEATPLLANINTDRYGTLSFTDRPFFAHDVPAVADTGVAEDMVTLTGTGLGFVSGETLTQGGVTATIYVVQEGASETRLWLANTSGGAFAAGAASSASGSGTLSGPAVYRGTMIDATPTTPEAAGSITWVPPEDHYRAARTAAGAVKGAVQVG